MKQDKTNNSKKANQRKHFNKLAKLYESHYDDKYSQQYRREFIYNPLMDKINLKNKKVLEAMCGSGQATQFLLEKHAKVTGLDISDDFINSYKKRWPKCEGIRKSILKTGLPDESFDMVLVIGGLHHLHPNLNAAVREIYRILKPNGYFCFMEPHKASILDTIRRQWYKKDKFFEKNEAAIDVAAMKKEFQDKFIFIKEKYSGGPAYFLVLQSMIFRVPVSSKKYYSPAMLKLEKFTDLLTNRYIGGFTLGIWKKSRKNKKYLVRKTKKTVDRSQL